MSYVKKNKIKKAKKYSEKQKVVHPSSHYLWPLILCRVTSSSTGEHRETTIHTQIHIYSPSKVASKWYELLG